MIDGEAWWHIRGMTTRLPLLVTLLSLPPCLACASPDIEDPPGCEGYVEFANAQHEASVAAALGIEGKVPGELFAEVDLFIAADSNLSSLQGFECAAALQQFYAGDNAIEDLTPIAGLSSLQLVMVANNQVSDLSPLMAKSTLHTLDVPGNPISSTAPIVDMPRLANVDLTDTPVTQLDGFTGLPELYSLRLGGTQIDDLSALAGLDRLDNLWLDDTPLASLGSLPSLPSLTMISARGAALSELGLAPMPMLLQLDLADNSLSEVGELATSAPGLRNLNVDRNPLTGLDSVALLESVEILAIDGVGVADLAPLASLPLRQLYAGNNGIVDPSPVADVEHLALPDNDIVDISALAGTSDTTFLDLRNNQIADFEPLLSVVFDSCAEVQLSGNPAANYEQVADMLCAADIIVAGYCLPSSCEPCEGAEDCG